MKRKQIRPLEYDENPESTYVIPDPDPTVTEEIPVTPSLPESVAPSVPLNGSLVYYAGGGNAKIVGSVTGNVYIFIEGKPTLVDNSDLPDLLSKVKVGMCCGSNIEYKTKLFELA